MRPISLSGVDLPSLTAWERRGPIWYEQLCRFKDRHVRVRVVYKPQPEPKKKSGSPEMRVVPAGAYVGDARAAAEEGLRSG